MTLPLLDRLRRATRHHHRHLDHHPVLQPLVRPGLDRAGHARALHALHGPHALLETAVATGARRLGVAEGLSPPRLALLEQDLRALGEAPPPLPAAGLAPAESLAALVGQRYVLEGSRLGGETIARQLRRALGPDVPVAFFAAQPPAHHWRAFLDFAAAHCPAAAVPQAIATARAAFEAFRTELDRTLTPRPNGEH